MELVYLWVEKYKNIENQGFNFSPRFTCEYENGELTIEEKKDYVSIFPDNINVTAIVGENGSGKSSILEMIFYTREISKQCFLIFSSNKNEFFIKRINLQSIPKCCFNQSEITLQNYKQEHPIIYFSSAKSLFDPRNHEHINNQFDISDYYNYEKIAQTMQHKDSHRLDSFWTLWFLNDSENSQKMVQFFSKKLQLPENIVIPTHFNISLDCSFIKTKFHDKTTEISKDPDKKALIEKFLLLANNPYTQIRDFEYSLKHTLIFVIFLNKIDDNSMIENFLDTFKRVLTSGEENQKTCIDTLFNELKELSPLVKYIDAFLEIFRKLNEYLVTDTMCLSYTIASASESIIKLINLYHILIFSENSTIFLETHFSPRMSSGQEQMLLILAKIDKTIQEGGIGEKFMLLLDEAEIYLHPNWQKQFIFLLIKMLEKKEKPYQIICTSHSPFILSDLPKENVIFLKNGKQDYPNIETFGANIHTLLSHGFFMKDGLMGEFAKSKINEVIDYLNGKNSPIKDDNEAQKYIHIIGEPIVKRQLQRMLDSKKLDKIKEIDALKSQIESLQNRLDILVQND